MISVHDFDANSFVGNLLTNKISNESGEVKVVIHKRSIPANVKKVEVLPDENNPKVVIVTFEDNDVQRAVVSKDDTFNLETGITICIAKHLLYCIYRSGNSSSLLNNVIRKAIRTYNTAKAEKLAAEELTKQRAERAQRKHEKRKAKREAEALAFKEKMIEIQKEAYIRAMRELNSLTETTKWNETRDKDGNEITYSINVRGFGTPMDKNMAAEKYLGMTYLDKNTGYVYHAKPYNGDMGNIQWIKQAELMKMNGNNE